MARTTRVELNRATLRQLAVLQADALMDVAQRVLEVTRVPDAPPYSQGLVEGGGFIGYVGRKKVGGSTIGGRQIKKPRSLPLSGDTDQQTVAVGFGFPARFVELGTVDTPAQPFLTPAVLQVAGAEAEVIISDSIRKRLGGIRSYDGSGHRAARAARTSS